VKSAEYWKQRTERRGADISRHIDRQSVNVAKIYSDAAKIVQRDIERTYQKYSDKTGIDVGQLKELLSRGETDRFWKTSEGKLSRQYIKENYKARITRLEEFKHNIYAEAMSITKPRIELSTKAHAETIKRSYLRTAYDIEQTTGRRAQFTQINTRRLNRMLAEQWNGANYSQNIWNNTNRLAQDLSQRTAAGLLAGKSPQYLAREVRQRFDVGAYEAMRLIRTETTYFENEAEARLYEELGITEYVFMATLDTRTSEICGSLDDKRFKLSEREVGVNCPPMHPNCRSKIRAYLGDDAEPSLRRSRLEDREDPDTAPSEVQKYRSFNDWQNDVGEETLSAKPTAPPIAYAINDVIGTQGEPMEPEEAIKANPRYDEGGGYKSNCQRCVPAYELRRRGYDVEALPNTPKLRREFSGTIREMEWLWKKEVDFLGWKKIEGRLYKSEYPEMVSHTKELPVGARLQVFFYARNGRSGHTLVAERVKSTAGNPDGLRFIDPQNGESFDTPPYKNKMTRWGFMRIDNAKIDTEMLPYIVKKSEKSTSKPKKGAKR
jgi:SPP1 gp7 family putative phage head morphogenesis protein